MIHIASKGKVLQLLLILTVLLLSACGGDSANTQSPDDAASESPAGIWVGILHSGVSGTTHDVIGMVTEDNEARFIAAPDSEFAQFGGIFIVSHDNMTGNMKAYARDGKVFPDGSSTGKLDLIGTALSKRQLSGTYMGLGDSGSFSLRYSRVYDVQSSLERLTGSYSAGSAKLIVHGNGNISLTAGSGCTGDGTASIINPSFNIYRIDIHRTCYAGNGFSVQYYSGLATLGERNDNTSLLFLAISDEFGWEDGQMTGVFVKD